MDPDATLTYVRRICEVVLDEDYEFTADSWDDLRELAEACQSLDEWILRGGYLPKPWR